MFDKGLKEFKEKYEKRMKREENYGSLVDDLNSGKKRARTPLNYVRPEKEPRNIDPCSG